MYMHGGVSESVSGQYMPKLRRLFSISVISTQTLHSFATPEVASYVVTNA